MIVPEKIVYKRTHVKVHEDWIIARAKEKNVYPGTPISSTTYTGKFCIISLGFYNKLKNESDPVIEDEK